MPPLSVGLSVVDEHMYGWQVLGQKMSQVNQSSPGEALLFIN